MITKMTIILKLMYLASIIPLAPNASNLLPLSIMGFAKVNIDLSMKTSLRLFAIKRILNPL